VAFSALVGDANFACPALQIDKATSRRVPTYAYEFNDNNAPEVFAPTLEGPPVATHASEEHRYTLFAAAVSQFPP
jgi:para-nitrobenzyl esterase